MGGSIFCLFFKGETIEGLIGITEGFLDGFAEFDSLSVTLRRIFGLGIGLELAGLLFFSGIGLELATLLFLGEGTLGVFG